MTARGQNVSEFIASTFNVHPRPKGPTMPDGRVPNSNPDATEFGAVPDDRERLAMLRDLTQRWNAGTRRYDPRDPDRTVTLLVHDLDWLCELADEALDGRESAAAFRRYDWRRDPRLNGEWR